MDRRSRFSPDPVLQSLRARAASQPPRSSGTADYAVFAFPETNTASSNRSAQSPVRDRPWGQRLGRSPAAVSRVPQLRSASFSATAHPPENEIWPHGGGHFPSTFEEDDEESLDAWTDNFHGQPRSWANSDSRFRSQNPGARSRSLVATLTNPLPIGQGLSPTGGLSNDWNEAPLSHSIDQRFLSGHPTRINGSRAQSLQSTASMPAALAGMRGSHAEISNLSPFVRDPLGPRIVQEDISNGYDPWNSYMGTMREEEPGSGTNSRRHSVSVVQPRVRGIGFAATATNAAPNLDDAPSSRLNAALGRSIFSDEELAGDFNLLNLGNNSMHSNGHGADLHPSGATSYPHSVPRLNPQTHTRFKPNGGLQAPSGYAPLDTHLLSNRTPSDGRSPINDGGFPHGKAAHFDQFGATLAHVGHGRGSSPLGSLRSREASPVRHDRTPDYSPINPQVNEGPYGSEHMQPSHGPAIHEPVQGLSIDELPQTSRLVLVEFKLNRKEIFYCDASLKVKAGDRLIVEGDRGKDIGRVVDPDVEKHWANSQRRDGSDIISTIGSRPKAKRAYAVAGPQESLDLAKKEEDEQKALQLCQNKVRQKKLPMQVVDCEFQWDRRKLTFYFIAESRIDFRDLVRELFRLYKTRIWMSCVSGPLAGPTGNIVY